MLLGSLIRDAHIGESLPVPCDFKAHVNKWALASGRWQAPAEILWDMTHGKGLASSHSLLTQAPVSY